MLSGMDNVCYVRFPDDEKDDPDKPGQPNRVKAISAHKLDDYRRDGYVQCAADGGPTDKIIEAGQAFAGNAGRVAGIDDDPEAVKIQAEKGAEAPNEPPPTAAPPAATKSKADTKGGNG